MNITSAQELLRVVEDTRRLAGESGESLLDATCWFVAVQEAQDIREARDVRDYAGEILEGRPLGGPFKTEAHLEEWVKEHNETYGDWEDRWDWLQESLDDHFGVRKEGE